MKTIMFALAAFALLFTAPAEAHHKRKHHVHQGSPHRLEYTHRVSRHHMRDMRHRLSDGRSFVRGRLICAINVSRELRAMGKSVPLTWSSREFRKYTLISKSQAKRGDIRFNWRRGGGHVMLVWARIGNVLHCKNPSSRQQGWQIKACPAGGEYRRIR